MKFNSLETTMKVRVDSTVEHLTESNRPFDPVDRILVMTSDGSKFDIGEDRNTGALIVRTISGPIVVLPQVANSIRVREERF